MALTNREWLHRVESDLPQRRIGVRWLRRKRSIGGHYSTRMSRSEFSSRDLAGETVAAREARICRDLRISRGRIKL
jgi:hypothetical protein